MKIICRRFHIITPFTFWDMRGWHMWNVYLQTFRNNRICEKWAYFLGNLQISRVTNSGILTIKDVKMSGCYIHINKNVRGDFQICISISLTDIHISSFNSEKFQPHLFHVFFRHWIIMSKLRYFCTGNLCNRLGYI